MKSVVRVTIVLLIILTGHVKVNFISDVDINNYSPHTLILSTIRCMWIDSECGVGYEARVTLCHSYNYSANIILVLVSTGLPFLVQVKVTGAVLDSR